MLTSATKSELGHTVRTTEPRTSRAFARLAACDGDPPRLHEDRESEAVTLQAGTEVPPAVAGTPTEPACTLRYRGRLEGGRAPHRHRRLSPELGALGGESDGQRVTAWTFPREREKGHGRPEVLSPVREPRGGANPQRPARPLGGGQDTPF